MSENQTVQVGPCKCGGYGVVYNSETEERVGVCHDSIEEPAMSEQDVPMTDAVGEMAAVLEVIAERETHPYRRAKILEAVEWMRQRRFTDPNRSQP